MADRPALEMLTPQDAAKRLGSGPVDAAPYHDPQWFEDEREAVFKRSWIHIGHACEVPEPGCFIRRDLEYARASLLIVRGKDGQVRAFHNVCTHRGTQLTDEAEGRRSTFSCRYHMWTFGLDGALLSAPDFERFGLEKSACGLKQVHLESCAGLLFVNFARQPAQGLRDYLGAIADELEELPLSRTAAFDEYVFEIDANWKIYVDNFQENYHLKFIHPRTGAAAIGPENPLAYPTHYGFSGPHRGQTLWRNPALPDLPPTLKMALDRGMKAAARDGFPPRKTDFKLFPAMFLLGLATHVFTHTVYPVSVNRTRGVIRFYWPSRAPDASTRFAREFNLFAVRDVHAEDRGVIEAGQGGLGSGVLDVIHFQEHEMLCRHLNEQVRQRVEAYRAEKAQG
ncbi:MAG: aromatic ring-hydroxylating oxygenase subunit alpha [Novosphingobium sp.]